MTSAQTTAAAPARRDRVLVVDDDTYIVRSVARFLTTAGIDVTTASSGGEALAQFGADDGPFDLVVTDVSMPEMDGLTLLRHIRERDLDVPVIVFTAAPSIEAASRALEYGAFRYLVKPVDPDELAKHVRSGLLLRRVARAKREALTLLGDGDRQIGDRAGLEVKFESGLRQLWMAFQPIVSWRSRSLFSYEALVRTREPTLPHPGAFFDAAERLGRLQDLGRSVRNAAGLAFAEAGPADTLLFVNLHTRDLEDEELYDPGSALARIAPRVVLEITERASLDEVRSARACVARLRALGFRIAIDDLGAGYAGLTSFAVLEPEVVKIDMSLVRDVDTSPMKRKIVRSMVSLCEELKILVVAEGVETPAERDTLVELGCDLFQGYLFARPAPPFVAATY